MNRAMINVGFFLVGFILGSLVHAFGVQQYTLPLLLLSGITFGIGTFLFARAAFRIERKVSLKKPDYVDFIKIVIGMAFVLSSLGVNGLMPPVIVYYFWLATMFIVGFSLLIGASYFARKLGRR